jgi:NAD(P)-dependent dehydrogenase (short-subunit alcohol dehydrogenase family)
VIEVGVLGGKAAIITGGGAGLGSAAAELFAAAGARVLVADLDVRQARKRSTGS